jgi:hypothetical protein
MTDPSSHQRGRPTSTNPQLSYSNKNLDTPNVGLVPRQNGQLTISRNITLTLIAITVHSRKLKKSHGWQVKPLIMTKVTEIAITLYETFHIRNIKKLTVAMFLLTILKFSL